MNTNPLVFTKYAFNTSIINTQKERRKKPKTESNIHFRQITTF